MWSAEGKGRNTYCMFKNLAKGKGRERENAKKGRYIEREKRG